MEVRRKQIICDECSWEHTVIFELNEQGKIAPTEPIGAWGRDIKNPERLLCPNCTEKRKLEAEEKAKEAEEKAKAEAKAKKKADAAATKLKAEEAKAKAKKAENLARNTSSGPGDMAGDSKAAPGGRAGDSEIGTEDVAGDSSSIKKKPATREPQKKGRRRLGGLRAGRDPVDD